MIPALQMMASSLMARRLISLTQARIEAGSARSQASPIASPPMLRATAVALSWLRAVAITPAPRKASTRTVSWPMPDVLPVTRTDLSCNDSPRVTSSAVDPAPKPVGPRGLIRA